jgi:hypothetical protein
VLTSLAELTEYISSAIQFWGVMLGATAGGSQVTFTAASWGVSIGLWMLLLLLPAQVCSLAFLSLPQLALLLLWLPAQLSALLLLFWLPSHSISFPTEAWSEDVSGPSSTVAGLYVEYVFVDTLSSAFLDDLCDFMVLPDEFDRGSPHNCVEVEPIDCSDTFLGDCGGEGQLPGSERKGDEGFKGDESLLLRRDWIGEGVLDGHPFAPPVMKKSVGERMSSPPEGM